MHTITVIGSGTMGAGIAQHAAVHDCKVYLVDLDENVVRGALESIVSRLDRAVEKKRMSQSKRDAALERIVPRYLIEDIQDTDLAIEAVVEDLAVKQKVFKQLEEHTEPQATLATNTSSLSVTAIAESLSNPTRLIGMHFFNPAPIMPLVEVISGKKSDPGHIDRAFATLEKWGKSPVRVKDTPGFIVNRVARGYYLEAMRLLDEGVGTVSEVDDVMKTHGGFRMGPFELMDLVGLDVNLAVSESVWSQMGQPARLRPHDLQKKLVESGHLGRKTHRGFYSYGSDVPIPAVPCDRRDFDMTPLLSDAMLAFCVKGGALQATRTEQFILSRILGAIINEAGLAYSDGVASSDDIDTAMIKGTNYPKGPLEWSDEIGHRTVRGLLLALNDCVADNRYSPASLFNA